MITLAQLKQERQALSPIRRMLANYEHLYTSGVNSRIPTPLAESIVAGVDAEWENPNETFLDVKSNCGTFSLLLIEKLLDAGHDIDYILDHMIYVVDSDIRQVWLTEASFKQTFGRSGNIIHGNLLDWQPNMKFKHVVGNPPYNESPSDEQIEARTTNNSNLYNAFILKSMELSTETTSLVVPAAWMDNKKLSDTIKDSGLKSVTWVKPECFPGVFIRSGISVLHTENGYRGKINIVKETQQNSVERSAHLTFIDSVSLGIIEKLKSQKSLASVLELGSYVIPNGVRGSIKKLIAKDPTYSEVQSKQFPHKLIAYSGKVIFSSDDFIDGRNGVALSTITAMYSIGEARLVEAGCGVSDRLKVVYFDTRKEAETAAWYLNSQLIKFLVHKTKYNNIVNTNKNSFGNIPMIDMTLDWDDQKLYQHFKLSAEEIKAVEAFS